ncbi:transcriptional repressor LexA [Cryptosporangium sp. NPDC051539]|uniref:transcriptional repressor LexA n=1 Tax=Cryptosporangium sp. NPDC051539 TaxID=3363962 RepID=UPI003787EB82
MATELSPRQRQILRVVRRSTDERGYPPSIREICSEVGLTSTSSVARQLGILEGLGLVSRSTRSARALDARGGRAGGGDVAEGGGIVLVPLLGAIAAGAPIPAHEDFEENFTLPTSLVGHGELFALRVRGDSMIEAAICHGDIVVVRRQATAESGEIVAAMLDGEATVKELELASGHVRLLPRNEHYEPIPADDAEILGRVVSVLRRLS